MSDEIKKMKDLLYQLKHDNTIYVKVFENTIKSNKEEYGDDIINYSDDDGCTALMYACKKGCLEIVEFLLKEGADVNKRNRAGGNALTLTMFALRSRLLYMRYNKDSQNIYECIKRDMSTREYAKIIEILIKYDAEALESQAIVCGETESCNYVKGLYLLKQVELGNLEKLQQCIGKGLDIDFRYFSEITALMLACKNGHYEVALTLITAGADINAKDIKGKSVAQYAAEGGNIKIMELLLARGADSGIKN